jgi:hypothetical protein
MDVLYTSTPTPLTPVKMSWKFHENLINLIIPVKVISLPA